MNFKGKDCVIHVPQRLAGMGAWTTLASEGLNTFVAPSSLSAESVVSSRHPLYARSRRASRRLV